MAARTRSQSPTETNIHPPQPGCTGKDPGGGTAAQCWRVQGPQPPNTHVLDGIGPRHPQHWCAPRHVHTQTYVTTEACGSRVYIFQCCCAYGHSGWRDPPPRGPVSSPWVPQTVGRTIPCCQTRIHSHMPVVTLRVLVYTTGPTRYRPIAACAHRDTCPSSIVRTALIYVTVHMATVGGR